MSTRKYDSMSANTNTSTSKAPVKTHSDFDRFQCINNGKKLIQAVKIGNIALVRKLLNYGVSQNIRDRMGCSPLYHAARFNRVEVLKILLENGNYVNAATKMNRTPLQIAASYGHTDIVRILVANKADVNSVDPCGMSALHWAAENNFIEIVKILLKAGADRTLINKFGKTAQSLAFSNSHFEVCKLLQEEPDPDFSASEYLLNLRSDITAESRYGSIVSERESTFPKISVISKNLQNEFRGQLKLDMSTPGAKSEALKLFEKHGIRLLPEDQSTVIANALKHGQIAVLTEAGKLALKKTEPYIIRRIANMSNPSQVSTLSQRISANTLNSSKGSNSPPKRKMVAEAYNKSKVIKIKEHQSGESTADDQKIMNRSVESSSTTLTLTKPQRKTFSCTAEEFSSVQRKFMISLKSELDKKSLLITEMKKQVTIAERIAKHFKTKYEEKEREAALYKTQLVNFTKFLSKSAISGIAGQFRNT